MLKTKNKTLNLALTIALMAALIFTAVAVLNVSSQTTEAADISASLVNGDIVTLTGESSGTLTVPAGADVFINGNGTTSAAGITLVTGAGATVHWTANYQGSSAAYCIILNGTGALKISSCTINNMGAGGAINITGGATVTVDQGGLVYSGTSGNGILVSADNAKVNVKYGGSVASLEGNGNAALQIGSGSNNNIQGTEIIIDGGSVVSVGVGYAINDGAGSGNVPNNTMITIEGGIVKADTACAIHSTGTGSSVTVRGGAVSNAASNNSNPTIYMNGGFGYNVNIEGGEVVAASTGGYAIQTTGNVYVSGGLVTAINGRAINLVGMDSVARVAGGTVETTGNGTAISTATTNITTVANASVEISGGTVHSANGYAVNVTGLTSKVTISGGTISATGDHTVNASGANSKITVSGGTVSSTSTTASNHAINATGSNAEITVSGGTVSAAASNAINTTSAATNAKITVSGGKVFSTNGRAINALSTSSSVTVNGPDSQVWVMRSGPAINSGGTITVSDGFVFALGSNVNTVLNASSPGNITWPTAAGGVVAVWNQSQASYELGTFTDITRTSDGSAVWGNNTAVPIGSGIRYTNNTTAGFFLLSSVFVYRDYGLIFDVTNGFMYRNIDGSNKPDYAGGNAGNTRTYPSSAVWSGAVGILTLKGFYWNTSVPIALVIYGGDVEIILESGTTSRSVSVDTQSDDSFGIYSDNDIKITGGGRLNVAGSMTTGSVSAGICADELIIEDGTLVAIGWSSTTGDSFGVDANTITINGGTLEAMGYTSALNVDPSTRPAAYFWWTNTGFEPSSDDGTPYAGAAYGDLYIFDTNDKYVKISATPFAAVRDETITGTVGTPYVGPFQTAIVDVYGTDTNALAGVDASSWFSNLPAGVTVTADAVSPGSTITFTFDGMPAINSDARFAIVIPASALASNAELTVFFNPDAGFEIDNVYNLFIDGGKGGTVTGTASGWYNFGDPVNLEAIADKGYHFTGWKISGVDAILPKVNPAVFTMPSNNVIVTATWGSSATSSSGGANTDITNATFDKYQKAPEHKDITVTLSPGSHYFVDIKCEGYTLKAGVDYTVSGNTYTIKKEYLSTLSEGTHSFLFGMSGGSNPVLKVTVKDTTPSQTDADVPPKVKELSIVNLVCMIFSVVMVIFAIAIARNKDSLSTGTGKILWIGTLVLAIAAIVLFFLTQGFDGHYVALDGWSPIMAVLTVAAAILLMVSVKFGPGRG